MLKNNVFQSLHVQTYMKKHVYVYTKRLSESHRWKVVLIEGGD